MTETPRPRSAARPAIVWLALAAVLLLISNGRWIVPAATWLAPAALLVFVDRTRPLKGLATGAALYVLVQFVVWWRLIPAPGLLYFLIAGLYGLVYFLPFVVHRLLAPRLDGLRATLVFPAAWIAVEYTFQTWITPYGSWFSLAYTQVENLTLLQLSSITGIWGVSFLITWFAAVAACYLGGPRGSRAPRRVATVYGLALLAVLAFGWTRLALAGSERGPLRTAGVVAASELTRELEASLAPIRRGAEPTPELFASIARAAGRLNEDLFARTRREARAGARLIAWSETAGRIVAAAETDFLERAGRLARDESVALLIAYGVWHPDRQPAFDNKVAAVAPSGHTLWEYRKARPIVGAESPYIRAGDGVVRVLETPQGRIGAVICHDLDFPDLLRQAHREHIGLVVAPSADWVEITALHAHMALPRAIESGFSLLRPTSHGRSIAIDAYGRRAAAVDHIDDALIAHLPVEAVRTLYGVVGDLFAWLCIAGLGALTVAAWRR